MRSFGFILIAMAEAVSAAVMPQDPVFSMSFKVTAMNGELATAEGRARAIDWLHTNGFSKVWLETYRHNEYVPTDRLVEIRDAFRKAGFETCGLITYTMLNDPPKPDAMRSFVNCWTDPKARERTRAEAERAARVFDVLLLDDFMFTNCTCPLCEEAKRKGGFADWGAYRRHLITDVLDNLVKRPAQAVNPKAKVIVKYQCWYEGWFESGDDPAVQVGRLGACWIGTETRDICPDALKACWINDFIAALTDDRCVGAWYDPLDCSPAKYVEQARYTILGGARESLVHAWDYLLAKEPGLVPFGQSPKNGHACLVPFERERPSLFALAKRLAGAIRGNYEMKDGVSTHEFFKAGKKIVVTMDTKKGTVATEEMPQDVAVPTAESFRTAQIDPAITSAELLSDCRILQRELPDPSLAFNIYPRSDGGHRLVPKLPEKAMRMLAWSRRRK